MAGHGRKNRWLEHFPEKACPGLDPGWTPISGLPEIGSQCRPSRLQPTWVVSAENAIT
jgi:hypothetical protein